MFDSYLIVLSLSRLRFRAICTLFLLVDGVCCNKDAMQFVSLLRSVHVEASPTNTAGVCSSRFLFEVLLIISSPCLEWVLKSITDCQTIFPTSLGRGHFQGIFIIYDLQVLWHWSLIWLIPFSVRSFGFSILQASEKLLNTKEKLHNS